MGADELRQADLSHLTVQEMTPAERAELKRRYQRFIANFEPGMAECDVGPKRKRAKPKKWVPPKRARG